MLRVDRVLPAAQKRLITVKSDALLIDAARLLDGPQRNLVIVCDGGRMAGVVTKTDVVSRISHCTGCSCTMAVTEAMTKDVTFCRPEDQLHDAWSVIKQHGLTNIPIVDQESKPVGVLNARDALRALLEDVQYEEQLLYDYVMGVGYR
jgi:CBS domain-containing protein